MGENPGTQAVAILLCTHNGARFLEEQLDSLERQTHVHWRVWASDDASSDATLEVLARYQQRWGADRLSIRPGPGRGFVANFLSLACDTGIEADYFCFCDQDDIWDADKLARALAWHQGLHTDLPALYCGRTRLIDDDGKPIGFSPLFKRPPSFQNAMVQSIAGGNTMVFNQAARGLLAEAGPDVSLVTHDWWLYILVSGCGGSVRYDPVPAISYRQHVRNVVGSNATWRARFNRARLLMQGRFTEMNRLNLVALTRVEHRMAKPSHDVLEAFSQARQAGLMGRIAAAMRSGVYHHTFLGKMGLIVATLFKKL